MSGFLDDFPVDEVLALLGDDITHITQGGSVVIKGEFDRKYQQDAFGVADVIDVKHPIVQVTNAVADTITVDSILEFDSKRYSLLHKEPVDGGLMDIVLRSKKR